MTNAGTIYGVILNDGAEMTALASSFAEKPYIKPPSAPVVYIKPRTCVSGSASTVPLPSNLADLEAAPTLAILFSRDACGLKAEETWDFVGAACLALDVAIPHPSFYRPAVAQRCRDGFLPLGDFAAPVHSAQIVTCIDGIEVHRWSTKRLLRDIPSLIQDLSSFMTLRAGDLLLIGLPGDPPRVRIGQSICVVADSLPTLTTAIVGEIE